MLEIQKLEKSFGQKQVLFGKFKGSAKCGCERKIASVDGALASQRQSD